MSTKLPEESSSPLRGPPYSSNISQPPSGTTFRNHPYLRPRISRVQDDSSNMATQNLAHSKLGRRRRFAVPSPILSAHPLVTASIARLSPLQRMKLDRESQRHRLTRLFEIPEFFRVVREGWAAAVRAEKRASTSVSTSTQKEERNIAPAPSDNESTPDNKSDSTVSM